MAKSIPFAQRDMSNYNVKIEELPNGGRNIIYRPKLTPEEYERRYKEFQQATVDFMVSYWNWKAEQERKKAMEQGGTEYGDGENNERGNN